MTSIRNEHCRLQICFLSLLHSNVFCVLHANCCTMLARKSRRDNRKRTLISKGVRRVNLLHPVPWQKIWCEGTTHESCAACSKLKRKRLDWTRRVCGRGPGVRREHRLETDWWGSTGQSFVSLKRTMCMRRKRVRLSSMSEMYQSTSVNSWYCWWST